MSISLFAISCLTTFNLPWFMDLTFQVPIQYCSLQHRILLPSPVTSTSGCCFLFDSISSFFLDLFLHQSPVAFWIPTDLGSSSFIVISFCHFIMFMGFSRQEYWSGLPFPSSVDHVLSELSTMTHPSWVALHCMAHSFIGLDKAVVHVISLISFLWLWFSFCLIRIRGLWKLPDGRDWLWGKLGLVLMAGDVHSKSLIQFSVDGLGSIPSLLFCLKLNYGGSNEDNGNLLRKVSCIHCCTLCPQPWSRPPPTHTAAGDSWTLTGKSESVSFGVTSLFSWDLVHTKFCLCPSRVCFPSLV